MRLPLTIIACTSVTICADDIGSTPKAPANSAEASLKSLAVAPGLRVDLWASEPLLKDPVAFTFDNAGRAYVAETGRRRTSMQDIRKHDDWVIENLALRSVEDRIAFLKRKLAPELNLKPNTGDRQDFNKDGRFDWRDLEVETETIRVIEDTDGDGRADQSRVLAEGFHSLATGIGAGIVVGPDGNIYYTCVPDLWLIKSDGTKKRLSTGYGAHVAFSGHDMHGVRIGPDGRLYFTIGDTGASVLGGDGKRIECPDSGAVFRCSPDGTALELFAWGLRNPQHLAFNEVGDLFTCDNNADGGDKARVIHVVEGADYGWRIGHQFMPGLGVWNLEGWWHLDAAAKNASILPPIAHIGHGPAGFSYYPGTGLPTQYHDHFFMADFPGGIRAFKLKQKGATYELDGFAPDAPVLQNNKPDEMTGKLLWNLDPSDVQFAPGGGVMVLDWTKGWEKSGRGRIFRVHDPATDAGEIVRETARLLRDDFTKRNGEELAKLLGHADQRARIKAQFELARRGNASSGTLLNVIEARGSAMIARLHALWALGQIHPPDGSLTDRLIGYLRDPDSEFRAQAARLLGEQMARPGPARRNGSAPLIAALDDTSPRVRYFAAEALAKWKFDAGQHLIAAAGKINPADAFSRHALSYALKHCAPETRLLRQSLPPDATDTQRMTAVLTLRRAGDAAVSDFLNDSAPAVRLEAARAIHDAPIVSAMPALASVALDTATVPETTPPAPNAPLARRIVNANHRIGTAECARRLAIAAADPGLPEPIRADALDALTVWTANLGRDRVLGSVMPGEGRRSAADAAAALEPVLPKLLAEKSAALRISSLNAAGTNKVRSAEQAVALIADDPAQPGSVRAAALIALDRIDAAALAGSIRLALESKDAQLLEIARRISTMRTPGIALEGIIRLLETGTLAEKRQAIESLGTLRQPGADQQLRTLIEKVASSTIPAALHLDILEAAARRSDPGIKSHLAAFEKARKADDPLARWRECLEGGDAAAGRVVFTEKAEAGCQRCHSVNKIGGDVGPDLGGFGAKHDRNYILRAIVTPDTEIAPGYENVLVTLKDGNVVAGLLNKEDADLLTLKNVADGKLQRVEKTAIKERTKLPSAMIPGLGEVLTKRELRDLIEFLATL